MRLLTILAILAVVSTLLFASELFAAEGTIKIAALEGNVLVKIQPSTEWVGARIGTFLNKDDSIKTDGKAKAYLEFPDKSSISLKPNTEIIIEDLIWDNTAKKVNLKMTSGELKGIINKVDRPSEFKIKTPTAICGARGTIFYVIVFPDGTGLYLEEGSADLMNIISGRTCTVYQGSRADSSSDGSISAPRELSKEEVDGILSGWDVKPVAEPYEEPAGGGAPDSVVAPNTVSEEQASKT